MKQKFEKFLIDENVYIKYCEYVRESALMQIQDKYPNLCEIIKTLPITTVADDYLENTSFTNYISKAFPWTSTKLGTSYWITINFKWYNIYKKYINECFIKFLNVNRTYYSFIGRLNMDFESFLKSEANVESYIENAFPWSGGIGGLEYDKWKNLSLEWKEGLSNDKAFKAMAKKYNFVI